MPIKKPLPSFLIFGNAPVHQLVPGLSILVRQRVQIKGVCWWLSFKEKYLEAQTFPWVLLEGVIHACAMLICACTGQIGGHLRSHLLHAPEVTSAHAPDKLGVT